MYNPYHNFITVMQAIIHINEKQNSINKDLYIEYILARI